MSDAWCKGTAFSWWTLRGASLQLDYLQWKQQKFRLRGRVGGGGRGLGGKSTQKEPIRCPDIRVWDVALISPDTEAREAQWTPKYRHMGRSHATTRGKAPLPPPPLAFFLLFGENTIFKYFLLLSLPHSLTPSLLPGLPTPQTGSPGSNQPDQHVIEIACLFNLYLLLCHPWQNPGSRRVNLQLA